MELLQDWYVLLSGLSARLAWPLGELSTRIELPAATAFIFGLIGAVAPCQLTTNASAIAFIGRNGAGRGVACETAAFVGGKLIVYTALGALAFALGTEMQRAAVPLAVLTRRALGPVLFVVGLSLLGVFRLRGGFGSRLAVHLGRLAPASGAGRAFVMGSTFALGFCPTLFWLFFGLTLPLALTSRGGLALPVLFGLGTAVPVLLAGGLLAAGDGGRIGAPLARTGTILTRLAGVVFVLAGINDTMTYWAL